MKTPISILIIIIIFSCSPKEKYNYNINERKKDINDIINTLINNEELGDTKILSSLRKVNILFDKKEFYNEGLDILITDSEFEIPYTTLINPNNPFGFFEKNEIDFLKVQNNNTPDTVFLDKSYFNKDSFIEPQVILRSKKFNYPSYIEYTIPIFSKDKKLAYVKEGYHCGGLCGGGKEYILKKLKGKWVIIDSWNTWIA
ncbi:hypothetical protein [Moheibacter lacus]|uniref:Lipoprotein n=1 Tax=Moheibacter lacus TaxID=2745851 RepID=A0A838ZTH5_9FLAO|nr:hypothetical protein [Moheibacter lacus]MBA5630295.1 hypothetical protein [Moheibacter lacus]